MSTCISSSISENKLLVDKLALNEQRTEALNSQLCDAQQRIDEMTEDANRRSQAYTQLQEETLAMKKLQSLTDKEKGELADNVIILEQERDQLRLQVLHRHASTHLLILMLEQ